MKSATYSTGQDESTTNGTLIHCYNQLFVSFVWKLLGQWSKRAGNNSFRTTVCNALPVDNNNNWLDKVSPPPTAP
jgi:hypothetical protein